MRKIYPYYPKIDKDSKCLEVCRKRRDGTKIGSIECQNNCLHNRKQSFGGSIFCDCIHQAKGK